MEVIRASTNYKHNYIQYNEYLYLNDVRIVF